MRTAVLHHDEPVLDPDLLLDADSRDRLLARFGAEVDSWFAALSELVELYCVRWHLELDKGLSGSTSRVSSVDSTASGAHAIPVHHER